MRKLRAGVFVAALAVMVGLAASAIAKPSGGSGGGSGQPEQGAQKATLGSASGNMMNCHQSSGSNGFAILNDPGKVGAVRFTEGEVHLTGGAANTKYDIFLGSGSSCMMTGDSLTTDASGTGNGHIDSMPSMSGQVFAALFNGMQEAFATTQVPLQ